MLYKLMKKLITWFDKHILKIGIGFLLIFIPLWPKLPVINIYGTWTYVRLEDFFVALLTITFFIQTLRKKVTLSTPLTLPIFIYWIVGGLSLVFSLIFLASSLPNFFPNVAVLHYLRRVEYMVVFFIAFNTIKSLSDVKHYLVIIAIAVFGVVVYGFGQHFLGFPAFLTMNEEFAKGIPLRLPSDARVASTFGGHYDLAAWLILMIPLLGSLVVGFRRIIMKLGIFILALAAFILLLFTASRISFVVYLISISFMLYLLKQKKFIVPVIILSTLLMSYVSGTSQRFGKTLRVERVVYNSRTGQPIALVEESPLEASPSPTPQESLPLGSGFLTVPLIQKEPPEATTSALVRRSLKASLLTATTSSEIATISGEFLIKRALVYDISFTTRFQGEWPRALEAFNRDPLLGSGYSSISLATDNDYLRALGETGILGFSSFLLVLFTFLLLARQGLFGVGNSLAKSVIAGVCAGLLGLAINAVLIDVFEASKVAFSVWMILGIAGGLIVVSARRRPSLLTTAIEVLQMPVISLFALAVLGGLFFLPVLKNYFVANDFTWLRWVATSAQGDITSFFFNASGFFYRPLAKLIFFGLYPILGLKPQGYHLILIFLYLSSTILVYFLALFLTRRKLIALLTGIFFLFHPIHAESVIWISSLSATLAATFYLAGFLAYILWRQRSGLLGVLFFTVSIFAFFFALISHELSLSFPLAIFLYDIIFSRWHSIKTGIKNLLAYLPFLVLTGVYLWVRNAVAGAYVLGSDYSYSGSKVAFNFISNLWGYLGEMVVSFNFLPLYDLTRSTFQQDAALKIFTPILLVFIIIVLSVIIRQRKKLVCWWENFNFKIFVFSGGWFIVTLLIFLGFGNISEGYTYLSSFGFILAAVLIIDLVWKRLKNNLIIASLIMVALIGGISSFYIREFNRANQSWYRAGETTNKILLALSSNYETFPSGTTLYFIDLPLRYDRAWVFPVGLSDGLWFIYRDDTLKIKITTDQEKTLDLAKGDSNAYVFLFENNELKVLKEGQVERTLSSKNE